MLTCAKKPCVSCPYRKDVPSGVWAREEYEKLPAYDKETWAQPVERFDCHQADGHLCAGWVAVHGRHALALRILRWFIDRRVFDYTTSVPLFASGAEACAHGLRDIDAPGVAAIRIVNKLADKGTIKEWG